MHGGDFARIAAGVSGHGADFDAATLVRQSARKWRVGYFEWGLGISSFGNVIKELQKRFSAWVLGPFDCIM
jgi:hypothetical protein